MRYHFKVHQEKRGYWAECIELKGCLTQANTKKELMDNAIEALNLYLDEPESSKMIFPEPQSLTKRKNVIEVPVDPKIAFAMALRQERVKNHLTQNQVARNWALRIRTAISGLKTAKQQIHRS